MRMLSLEKVKNILEEINIYTDRENQIKLAARNLRDHIDTITKNRRFLMGERSFIQRLYDFPFRKIWNRTDKLLLKCSEAVSSFESDNAIETDIWSLKSLLSVAQALAKFKKWFYTDDDLLSINVRPLLFLGRHPSVSVGVGKNMSNV